MVLRHTSFKMVHNERIRFVLPNTIVMGHNIQYLEEEKQDLLILISDKKPCEYTYYAKKLGIVCDAICPLRVMEKRVYEALLTEIAHKKYREDRFDED